MEVRVYTDTEELIKFTPIGTHQILKRLGYIRPFINTSFFEKLEKLGEGLIVDLPLSDKIPGLSEEGEYYGIMVSLEENLRNAPALDYGKGEVEVKDGSYFLMELYERNGKFEMDEVD